MSSHQSPPPMLTARGCRDVKERRSGCVTARRGQVWQGRPTRGLVWRSCHSMVRLGQVRRSRLGTAGHGAVCRGAARRSSYGSVCLGPALPGWAGQGGRGMSRRGRVRHGMASLIMAVDTGQGEPWSGDAGSGEAVAACLGWARPVEAWRGGRGMARPGQAGRVTVRRGEPTQPRGGASAPPRPTLLSTAHA